MHWYVNSGAMTVAVTNAVDVVSSAINASLLTNDTHVCDHVFSALPPDCEMSIINVCQEMWKVLLCPCIRNKFVISLDSRPLPLQRLTSVPVLSSLWEIKSQTSSILLFSRIWCCWWKLETKCWESTFLAVWVAKQNVPSRLSDRAFSETHLIQTLHKLKVRKTISLTKLTQILKTR